MRLGLPEPTDGDRGLHCSSSAEQGSSETSSRREEIGVRVDDYVLSLDQIDAESLPLVGGKGANLGELTRAQLPVPSAFCVTTRAYRRLLEANSLLAPILDALAGLDYEDATEIERRTRQIRETIATAQTPSEVEVAIRGAYSQLESRLGAGALVSVRSSATAEDLPGASFAGQQDTYLNIHGADQVVEHVKR